MDNEYKVSIVVPVYNAAKYIGRGIESILNQTYTNIELIIVNDGSKDNSLQIIEAYAKKDNRIKCINRENSGVSATRNAGINNATGKYIMFVDADDTINKDTVKDNVKYIVDNSADIVICGFYYHVTDEKITKENPIEESFTGSTEEFARLWYTKLLKAEIINPPWNKLIRLDIIRKNSIFFDERYSICEDMAFSIDVIRHSEKVVLNSKIYYNYFVKSTGSLVFKFYDNYFEALSNYYKKSLAFCNMHTENESNLKEVDTVYANLTIMYIKLICNNKAFTYKEKKSRMKNIFENKNFIKAMNNGNLNKKKKLIRLFINNRWYGIINLFYKLR